MHNPDPEWTGARGSSEVLLGSNSSESSRVPRHNQDQRARYARQLVFSEFRNRDARGLDQGNFVDRRPNEPPRANPQIAKLIAWYRP